MKIIRIVFIFLVIMVLLSVLPAGAQKATFKTAPMREVQEGEPSPDTGFIPPRVDLSHLTTEKLPSSRGMRVLPSQFDWRDTSDVSSVKDQSTCGCCYAFAFIGCFESQTLIEDDSSFDLSEDNVKECEYYGSSCGGGNFDRLANYTSQVGTVLESCDPYQPVTNSTPPCGTCAVQQNLLDWGRICDDTIPDTYALKEYIYNYGPVMTSIWVGYNPADAGWNLEFNTYDGSYTFYKSYTGATDHAVLIVGWDDTLVHSGGTGGWIVKNSWGSGWGSSGYFTIAYESAAIGKYSSFIQNWEPFDPDSEIFYYDEGGHTSSGGTGSSTVAYGLSWYVPTADTFVKSVEFWTTDVNTTVDCSIYDDWNPASGGTLGSLMASKTGEIFPESGYHSVSFDSPVELTNGDGVAVKVKFTNSSYNFPVAFDNVGPVESQKTFISSLGVDGSWQDFSTALSGDAGIRLRVTSKTPIPTPTPTPATNYDNPATQGWEKSFSVSDGFFINAVDGAFYIASHVTDSGSIGASGRSQTSPSDPGAYGSWTCPDGTVPYYADQVYRLEYTVRTTQLDRDKVPNCRLYAEFLKSGNILVAGGNRVGHGDFAPDGDGETYDVLLNPTNLSGVGADNLRLKFEVIDFAVEEDGTNYMDQLEISRMDETNLKAAGSLEGSFTAPFSSDWSSLVLHDFIPAFGDVTVGSDSTGLYITTPGPYTTDAINYGSWNLGSSLSGYSFESDKYYWVNFTLQKASVSDNPGKIRMFCANESGDWNSLIELEPAFETGHMPSTTGDTYMLWLTTLPTLYTAGEINNNRMSFNFDVSDGSASQSGRTYLTDVEIWSGPYTLMFP